MIKYIVPCVAILAIIVFILSPKLYRAKNKEEEFSYLNYLPVEAPITYKQKIINIFLTGVLAFLCAESYVSSLLVTSLTNVGLISSLILFVVSSSQNLFARLSLDVAFFLILYMVPHFCGKFHRGFDIVHNEGLNARLADFFHCVLEFLTVLRLFNGRGVNAD